MAFGKTSTVFVRTQSARAIAEIKTTNKLRFKKLKYSEKKLKAKVVFAGLIFEWEAVRLETWKPF